MFENEMILKTTKAVCTSLHDPKDLNKVVFRYRYERERQDSLKVKVDAYKAAGDDDYELVQGGSSYRTVEGEQLVDLIEQAEAITPPLQGESALAYFDRLVASGIKLVIVMEKLWQGKLGIDDFE